MIDKELLKKRFQKSLKTYEENAIVQKIIAQKLVELLPQQSFAKVLEIGCGSGVSTKIIQEKFKPEKYFLNDIVPECEQFINGILSEKTFLLGDIDAIETEEKFDLIISNAALQWSENLPKTFIKLTKMLKKGGVLAFSTFAADNFPEIRKVLGIGLNYQSPANFENIEIFELEPEILWFSEPKEVLKHLKLTGVNAVKQEVWNKTKLRNFENEYKKFFEKQGQVSLTYKPICAIFENFD